jgi:hypothetical protein
LRRFFRTGAPSLHAAAKAGLFVVVVVVVVDGDVVTVVAVLVLNGVIRGKGGT